METGGCVHSVSLYGHGEEVTQGGHVTRGRGLGGDAAVQEQEAVDQRQRAVGGLLLQVDNPSPWRQTGSHYGDGGLSGPHVELGAYFGERVAVLRGLFGSLSGF